MLALCVGAAAVGLRNGDRKQSTLILGIGIVAAISMLPYLDTVGRLNTWNQLLKMPIDTPCIASRFVEAAAPTLAHFIFIWFVPLTVTAISCAYFVISSGSETAKRQKDVAIFVSTGIVVGLVAYLLFLLSLSYMPRPWYYIVLIAFLATLVETAIQALVNTESDCRS